MIMTRSTLAARVAFHEIPGLRASLLVLIVVPPGLPGPPCPSLGRYRLRTIASVVPSTSGT
jgi:hypothetical protein